VFIKNPPWRCHGRMRWRIYILPPPHNGGEADSIWRPVAAAFRVTSCHGESEKTENRPAACARRTSSCRRIVHGGAAFAAALSVRRRSVCDGRRGRKSMFVWLRLIGMSVTRVGDLITWVILVGPYPAQLVN